MKHTQSRKHSVATKALYLSSLLWAVSAPHAAWAGTLHHAAQASPVGAQDVHLASLEQGTEPLQRAQTHKALMAALNLQVDQVSRLATEMTQARDQLTRALASGDEQAVAFSQQSLDGYRQAFYQAQVALRSHMKALQRFHAEEQAVN